MPTLFLLGDSTCAIKKDSARPETGWGECFERYLAPGWKLDNRAVNGRSTRQYLLEGDFGTVETSIQNGDAVLIQFGHNESKPEPWRHTEPWTSFQENLRLMIFRLRELGASPYLATPIARRKFVEVDGNSILQDTHGDYPKAMLAIAAELSIPCLDMTAATMRWLSEAGDEASKRFFMNFPAGLHPNYPHGKDDDTHLRPEGAQEIARMVYRQLSICPPKPGFLI